jgi:nicotinamidase-related amidase
VDIGELVELHPSRVAVVLIVFQNDFCLGNRGNAEAAYRARDFAERASSFGAHVVYTQQILDQNRLTPRQRRRESSGGVCAVGTSGAELFLAPVSGAAVVRKDRFDVWQSGQWRAYLDEHDIDGLVIAGVELRCCVLYAVVGADERGFAYVVPLDLVSGIDAGEHTDNEWVRRYLRDVHDAPYSSSSLLESWAERAARIDGTRHAGFPT